jgi:hypothetical protein
MRLTPGSRYPVTDWYGMVVFEAEYRGRVRAVPVQGSVLHLLERTPHDRTHTGCHKYVGCEVHAHRDLDGEVKPYLCATHYGDTVAGLKPAVEPERIDSWELVP